VPAQATLTALYRGISPPTNPTTTTLWQSQSVATLGISDSPADRTVILSPFASGFESGICQEGTLYWNTVLGRWEMLYSGSSSIGYAYSLTTPLGPWTKFGATYNSAGIQTGSGTAILGNGAGGEGNNAFHGRAYIEGTTIYFTYCNPTTNKIRVATAPLSSPQSLTVVGNILNLPSQGTGFGNSHLLKLGTNSYLLFYETLINSLSYNMGIASGTSPTGTFTPISQVMPSLWNSFTPDTNAGQGGWTVGGPKPFLENGRYVLYFHSAAAGSLTSEIFRATSIDALNWTLDTPTFPLVRRRHYLEASQVADICIASGPSEGYWATWEGYDNQAGQSTIFCTPCQEPINRWDGNAWVQSSKIPAIQPGEFNFVPYLFTGAHTAQNLDDVLVDATAGPITITLPRADAGCRVRVNHVGTGANLVTVVTSGGDTITLGASTIAAGASLTFRSYVSGRWTRANS